MQLHYAAAGLEREYSLLLFGRPAGSDAIKLGR